MQTQTSDNSAAPLTAEQIGQAVREAFPFDVDKLPLSGPEGLRTPFYGLFRGDTGENVGAAVKRGYLPHTVDDVAALAEAGAEAFADWGGAADIRCNWREGHYVTIQPTEEARRAAWDERHGNGGAHHIRRDSDVYYPCLMIRAGYDGTAFKGSLMVKRLICRNLMAIPVQGQTIARSIRHTAGLRAKMPELVADFRRVVDSADSVAETIDRAAQQRVDMADFLRTVYPLDERASDRSRRAHERRVERIMRRLHRERAQLGTPAGNYRQASAWEAYNAVQGFTQHDARRNGRPSDFERAAMALDDRAVARAAELAFA